MNQKTTKIVILIFFVATLAVVGAELVLLINLPAPGPTGGLATTTPAQPTVLQYKNNQYGFVFSLPLSWTGYTILSQNWEGRSVDNPAAPVVNGPEIIIRHPLWTVSVPRQDIPIMIFTYAQWDLIAQEKLSLGAAPIGPSELGRNANYVFALPARYNFAFPAGFQEVDQIIQSKPLRAP